MTLNANAIVELIGTVILGILSVFVVPWLKEHTSRLTRERIDAAYKTAVFGAEQMFKSGGCGAFKREEAERWIREHGMEYDRVKMEAVVNEFFGVKLQDLINDLTEEDPETEETPIGYGDLPETMRLEDDGK